MSNTPVTTLATTTSLTTGEKIVPVTTNGETVEAYYTILVPYVGPKYKTPWHPDKPTGPFAVLSRGAFKTEEAAIEWAQTHLKGTPYTLKLVTE